jgi:hypothetical protein
MSTRGRNGIRLKASRFHRMVISVGPAAPDDLERLRVESLPSRRFEILERDDTGWNRVCGRLPLRELRSGSAQGQRRRAPRRTDQRFTTRHGHVVAHLPVA